MATVFELMAPQKANGAQKELVRLIGLAGDTLVQLRADYDQRPNKLTLAAIKRKVSYLTHLAQGLDEQL